MRKIEIKQEHPLTQEFAEIFINEWHRHTSKKRPHTIMFTFNKDLWEKEIETVNWYLDILKQAFVINNNVVKILIDTDKRNSNYLTMNIW